MALSDNIVAYWSLTDLVDSAGSNTLTNNGAATFVTGKVGNAGNFVAASNQYLSIADNADLSMGDIDFTIAAWVNFTTVAASGIVSKSSGATAATLEYAIYFFTGLLRFQVSDGTTLTTRTASTFGLPASGTWYYVVAWHDSVANTINICVNDGTPDSASYSAGVQDSTHQFEIGRAFAAINRDIDGLVDEVGIWKRVLSGAEITELYNGGAGRDYTYIAGGAGPNYTLAAALGTYTLTGQATGLEAARILTALQGSFGLTGQDTALLRGFYLASEQGSFTLTGQAVGLLIARRLIAAQGSYGLTGQDVTLTYTPDGGPDYTLTADAGSYTLSGQAVSLIASRLLVAGAGAYVLTGQDASFLVSRLLAAGQGSYSLTGQAATLLISRLMVAGQGSYTLNGQAVTLVYSGEEAAVTPDSRVYVIPVEDRVYVIVEEDRTVIVQ